MNEDRNTLREQAYDALEAMHQAPVSRFWRTVVTDTESLSGFGPACPTDHPDLGDGLGRDDQGVYACCPHVVETFSVELAAFLVAVLNRDAAMNPQTSPCDRTLAHDAHDYTVRIGPEFRVSYTCPGLRAQDTEDGS
jgi:hypothetical protein